MVTLILNLVIAIWFVISKTTPEEPKQKNTPQESFKMLTVIKNTDPDDIYRALSDPKIRQMWDIDLKNAKNVNSLNKGQVLRLEYLGNQHSALDVSLKLIQQSPKKSYIIEDPIRIWILTSLQNGAMRVEIIWNMSDIEEMMKDVEKINALKLLLSLQNDPCDADSSGNEEEEEEQIFKSTFMEPKQEKDTVLEDPMWQVEVVDDWKERIKGYSPKQLKFYEKMLGKLDELINLGE